MNDEQLEKIEDQVLILDGAAFVHKHLLNCVLVYSGGTPPILRHSVIQDCGFRLEGNALNTADFLRTLIGAGAEDIVLDMLGLPTKLAAAHPGAAEEDNNG